MKAAFVVSVWPHAKAAQINRCVSSKTHKELRENIKREEDDPGQ
jgi:hypothetical protein